jgi:hypothetical protein
MIPKLSRACYAIRSMSHINSTDTFKSIYFAYFHSIMKYGIIFWSNYPKSKMMFTLQKRTIIIIAIHRTIEILPLPCEHIFTLMNFVVNNHEHFQTISPINSVNTRNRDHLHRPTANFSRFQKSAYYAGIKIFNCLPSNFVLRIKGPNLKQHYKGT